MESQVVLITGASGGLGKALCLQYGGAGATIVGLDIDQTALDALRSELDAQGIRSLLRACDICDAAACDAVVGEAVEAFGGIDVLVNNAGITHLSTFAQGSGPTIRKVMEVNFFGAVNCTESALPSIRARRGSVVVISSVAGFAPLFGRTGYSASKFALHGFFETLRTELHAEGVQVLMVCPSLIDTPIRRRVLGAKADVGNSTGKNTSPKVIAQLVMKAQQRGRRMLITGVVGHVAYVLRAVAPSMYDRVMRRKFAGGIEQAQN